MFGLRARPNADIFDPRTMNALFKVCTGHVNTGIERELIERGYEVETCAIGEPLQSTLETAHMNCSREKTRADIYYDPKELDKAEIPKKFGEVVRWKRTMHGH